MLPEPLDTTIAFKMITLMPELSGTDKRVAGTILDHYNRKTGRCDPGLGRIARLVGVSRRTVIRSVSNIMTTGILRKVRHGGHSQRNSYQPVWSRFRELEAGWKARFNAKSGRAARTNMTPPMCQASHLGGDEAVTQTPSINHSKKATYLSSAALPPHPGQKMPPSSKGYLRRGFDQGTFRRVPTGPSIKAGVRPRDAARDAAERRWHVDLNNRFAATPEFYAELVGAIDVDLQVAATEVEMKRRGGGLAYILEQLQARNIYALRSDADNAANGDLAVQQSAPTADEEASSR